jgi:hypothetical protein
MRTSLRMCLLSSAIAVVFGSALRADDNLNSLSDKEKADGWKLLFDGKTTQGWKAYKGSEVGDSWRVDDGVLLLKPGSGKRGGDIVTTDDFDNFELTFDWRISTGGNSGVMYRVSEDEGAPYFTGIEYQILDNAKHPDGRKPKTSAASAYDLYAPAKDMTKPVGEWNQGKIVSNGNHIEHWLNGEKVVEIELGSDDWNAHYNKSKFKNMKRFAKETKGKIDLQDHGNEVAYRNIKLKPLKAKEVK